MAASGMTKRYAFYAGCCLQGVDIRMFHIILEVMRRLDVEMDVVEKGVCCGSGVLEERSELTALAVNAFNMALAEEMGLPLFISCSTCYNVIANARSVLAEDRRSFELVNEILAREGLRYRGACRLIHILWAIAFDVGLDRLAEKVSVPLTGLRVAAFYGCHLGNPADIQDYEPSAHLTSMENVLRVLGADVVDYDTRNECCGYHLTWPNRELSLRMKANVLRGIYPHGVDMIVTACPLCHKRLDSAQPGAQAASGQDFMIPTLYLPQIVGLACGMTSQQVGLDLHMVPVNIRL